MKIYKGIVNPGEMNWKVYMDGKQLDPRYDLRNYSPSGLAWGYNGSGPGQLSLAMLADCLEDDDLALKYYQTFKFKVISHLEKDNNWEMTSDEVKENLNK